MKRKQLIVPVTAALALAFAFVPGVDGGILNALALPFTVLGKLLRALSLSGSAGNAAAITLLVLVSCIPLFFWWKSGRKREDWLLVLLAPVTALVLYYMVNPALRSSVMQNEVGDVVYAMSVWSTLVTWGILKLVRSREILDGNIYKALRIFLLLCTVSCIFDCFGKNLYSLMSIFKLYGEAGYTWESYRLPTMAVLVLNYLLLSLEDGLTALALWKGVGLMEELERDPFSEGCIAAADAVSNRCRENLVIISLAGLALNLLQLLMADRLANTQVTVTFPVMGMAVAFALMAVTKLLVRGKALKDESDLFI